MQENKEQQESASKTPIEDQILKNEEFVNFIINKNPDSVGNKDDLNNYLKKTTEGFKKSLLRVIKN
jgi:hypothetical protein